MLSGPIAAVAISAAPAAATTTQRSTVNDRAEAWYATRSITNCLTLIGCPLTALLTPLLDRGGLHVGAAAGKESSRTYLVPAVPHRRTAIPTRGTMRIPIDTGLLAGTLAPTSASVRACLVLGKVRNGVAGSAAVPPKIDCAVAAPAHFASSPTPHLSIRLDRFLGAWRAGRADRGIAVVPDLRGAASKVTWQLTIDGKTQARVPHIRSLLVRTVAASPPGPVSPTPTPTTRVKPAAPAVGAAPPPPASVTTPPAPTARPPVVASPPPVTSPAGVGQAAGFTSFHGRAVFLLPLLFLAAGMFLARLFATEPNRREDVPWPIVRADRLPSSRPN
jgi:hypothetical protein